MADSPKYVPKPLPIPSGDAAADVRELTAYLKNELEKLSLSLAAGRFLTIRMDVLGTELPRPVFGDMAVYDENVVNPQSGIYFFNKNGNWQSL